MKELYRLKEVALYQDGAEFVVRTVDSDFNVVEKCRSMNPIEAWTQFIDNIDCIVRRRIGRWCLKNGKNQYTGQRKEQENGFKRRTD